MTEETRNISSLPHVKGLPRHGQIELWLFPVSALTDVLRKEYEDILSSDERDFYKKIVIQDKKDLFITTKALLRKLLYWYTSVPTSEWSFEKNLFGRPYIREPSQYRGVRFNISHAKGLMAYSFSTFYEIGIDIENIFNDRDFVGISRVFFSEKEVDSINSAPSHKIGRTFYMYWTLKEAYLKARGIGLSLPLSSFWFEPMPLPRTFFSLGGYDNKAAPDNEAHHAHSFSLASPQGGVGADECWRFISKTVTHEHILALAVRASHVANINVRVYRAQHHAVGTLSIDSSYNIVIPAPPLNS